MALSNKGQISLFYFIIFICMILVFSILIRSANSYYTSFESQVERDKVYYNNYYESLRNSSLYRVVDFNYTKNLWINPQDIKSAGHYNG